MAVPVSGNFDMFGTGSTTSIAGAMHDTGDNVTGITTFNALISASNPAKFDFNYAGEIQFPDLDVSSSYQFRGYPVAPAICRAVWVDDTVDSSRYGLRYRLASKQLKDTLFNSLFGTAYTYGGNSGVVYNVCSTLVPSTWDSSNNTLVNLGSLVVNFVDGGDCYVNTDCVWTIPPTPTPTTAPTLSPTPTITNTPTPTPTPNYVSWLSERNDGGAYSYIGVAQGYSANSEVLVNDGSGQCWTLGSLSTVAPVYTIISLCPTATPTPLPATSTPVPTATPTAAPCTCYTLLEEGSQASVATITECGGATKNITLQPGVIQKVCLQNDPINPSGTFSYSNDGIPCTSTLGCNATATPTAAPATATPLPTATPTPLPATSTPVPTAVPTATPTPSPQSYVIENSDGSQYEYIALNTGFTTNDLITVVGYGTECWTVGGQTTTAPTVVVNGACVVATATPTPSPTPTPSCVQLTNFIGYSNIDSTSACNDTPVRRRADNADFSSATILYANVDCSTLATAGYYADPTTAIWRYWNGSSFTTSGICDSY